MRLVAFLVLICSAISHVGRCDDSQFAPTTPGKNAPPARKAPQGLVWIPGGEFSMGAANNGGGSCEMPMASNDAEPVHRVRVDGFWMDATTVTNEQFEKFVKPTGHVTIAERTPTKEEFPDAPAENLVAGSVVFAPTDHLFFHTGWGCMSADFVLKDGGEIIYCSPSPGVHTAIGDFPGLALMDLMKPYMPPTPENYQRVLRDIHTRTIQMWAGCIWVPIYEVMTRKRLTMVTLEENLAMAADIGMEATTSLEGAFAAAMERKGPDAKVIVLPFARYQLPRNLIRMTSDETPPVGAVAGA